MNLLTFRGTLVFVRHGETDWNVAGRIQGRTDIPLNEKGMSQCEELGSSLKKANLSVDLILASTLRRAEQTACILARCLDIPEDRVVFDHRMQECSFGKIEGKTERELDELTLAHLKYAHGTPYDFRAWGGEHTDTVIERQVASINEHAARVIDQREKTILLVGHGRSLGTLQGYLGALHQRSQGSYSLWRVGS